MTSSLLRRVASGLHLIDIPTPSPCSLLKHLISPFHKLTIGTLARRILFSTDQEDCCPLYLFTAPPLSLFLSRAMTPHRGNRRNNHLLHPQQHNIHSSPNLAQPSDYESELPTDYPSDVNNRNGEAMASGAAPTSPPVNPMNPTRTNEELNLAVLRRYNQHISTVLSLAPYAVVYLFNPTTQLWEKEKVGIEGTLFVCELTPGDLGEERYSVFILNRRGMQNFETRLRDGDDVQLTDQYVILRVDGKDDLNRIEAVQADGQQSIYGIWIFSEPPPSSTAETRDLNSRIIKECAVHGGQSRKLAEERRARSQKYEIEHEQGSVPMGRQISLHELFGQQRAQDDEWSVKVHSPAAPNAEKNNGADGDVLGGLFRKAVGYEGPR